MVPWISWIGEGDLVDDLGLLGLGRLQGPEICWDLAGLLDVHLHD
jgi:hypothetical protein